MISVFFFISSTKNNDKARDIHMLKNMLKMLKDEQDQSDKLVQESVNLAQHLKTTEIIKQGVESLSSNKFISSRVLSAFLEALKERLVSGKFRARLLVYSNIYYSAIILPCILHLTS